MLTQNDIILALEHVCDAVPDLATLKESIELMRTLVEGSYGDVLTEVEETAVLKAYTGNVAAMRLSINCYPFGLETYRLFDADGNLIG